MNRHEWNINFKIGFVSSSWLDIVPTNLRQTYFICIYIQSIKWAGLISSCQHFLYSHQICWYGPYQREIFTFPILIDHPCPFQYRIHVHITFCVWIFGTNIELTIRGTEHLNKSNVKLISKLWATFVSSVNKKLYRRTYDLHFHNRSFSTTIGNWETRKLILEYRQ